MALQSTSFGHKNAYIVSESRKCQNHSKSKTKKCGLMVKVNNLKQNLYGIIL